MSQTSEQQKDILLRAKVLIEQKQYEAARQLLLPIAQHPTAAKWLNKIDEILPPKFEFDFGLPPAAKPGSLEPEFPAPVPLTKKALPGDRPLPSYIPTNPNNRLSGCNALYILAPWLMGLITQIETSLRWGHYGKGHWVLPSLLLSAFVTSLSIAGLIAIVVFGSTVDIPSGPVGSLFRGISYGIPAGLFFGWSWALHHVQYRAFKHWEQVGGDYRRFEDYEFEFDRGAGVVLVGILFVSTIATGGDWWRNRDDNQTFQTEQLTIPANSDWADITDSELASLCTLEVAECSLILVNDQGQEEVAVMFQVVQRDYIPTLERIDRDLPRFVQSFQRMQLGRKYRGEVAGQAAVVQEFIFTASDSRLVPVTILEFVLNDHHLRIFIFYGNATYKEVIQPSVQTLVANIKARE
jgi:hypothetical protein